MNWWPLIHFGVGFLRGYADARANRRLEYEDQYDWGQHMAALANATNGVELLRLKGNTARFGVAYQGDTYPMVLSLHGSTVMMSIASLITFPSGRLPQDVVRFLAQRNRELPRCDYDCIDDEDGAFFIVTCRAGRGNLNAETFQAAIAESLPCIVALDTVLLRNGYAS